MDRLTNVVRRALAAVPCSLRELAPHAGVSHVQLHRIMRGTRRATPAVARQVARALDGLGQRAAAAARRIRQAAEKGESKS